MSRFVLSGAQSRAMRRLALGSFGILLAGCGGEAPKTSDSAATAATATTMQAADSAVPPSTEGLKVPESVRYDAALDAYFVSNIDGNPNQKDNNGFIVRLDAGNSAASIDLVRGGVKGVALNAPKGMAVAGDTLWVADIDVVRAFDKNSGAAIAAIDLSGMGATFLNDVAIAADGTVYVTDTGIRFSATGEMSHPGKDRIFAIAGGKARVALEGDSLLARPNGIAWDAANARFILAGFGGPDITAWKPGEQGVTKLATGPGSYDGVEVLADGRILVTSWADSSLSLVANGAVTRVKGGMEAPADIGVDTRRQRVAVPRFNAGRVDYVAIPK
ncbi:MAG: SMP-30/gluconolactonase/LRE family protein [Gemmatimonadaceae bacterium]|nr:SMP-30/gluconolactonase/LRE family protein [Gemmatimonadaceae bacterium]